MNTEKLTCLKCGKQYNHLGSHVVKAHEYTKANEYKAEFGLSYNHALISEEVKTKKQEAFEANKDYYIKNLLKAGAKYKFKKGHSNFKDYQSQESVEKATQELAKINSKDWGVCIVCKIKYKHIESHLFNKHGLKIAKDS